MDENLKDILSNLNPEVDQETLLLYLQGKLTAQQQHEVEKKLIDADFESEAMEGLQQVNDKKLGLVVDQLNRELRKRTEKKQQLKRKMQLRLEPWLIITVVAILVLIVISYLIIHFMTR